LKTIRTDGEDLLLTLRVQPRARDKRDVIVLRSDAIVVRLSAPPVDGKANLELVKLMARLFSRPKSAISVERGLKSRDKLVRVRGAGAKLPEALSALGLRLEQTCRS
jgi:uncharacterized protein (TIGR00251 family)